MNIEVSLLRLLMEIGHLAGGHGRTAEAEAIFEGLKAVRPESEYPLIGLAVARMNAGRAEEAVAVLKDQALKVQPDSALVQSFLGLALKLAGRMAESRATLAAAADSDGAPEAVAMAKGLLAEMGA